MSIITSSLIIWRIISKSHPRSTSTISGLCNGCRVDADEATIPHANKSARNEPHNCDGLLLLCPIVAASVALISWRSVHVHVNGRIRLGSDLILHHSHVLMGHLRVVSRIHWNRSGEMGLERGGEFRGERVVIRGHVVRRSTDRDVVKVPLKITIIKIIYK